MKRTRFLFFTALILSAHSVVDRNSASGTTIFESGTLGATGIPRSEVTGGSNVNPAVFVGVRFRLEDSILTTQVGGHFVKNTGADQSFFGAIISLVDANDFPDSGDLTTPDVVGTTLLSFPEPSNEVFGALVKPLNPGWYALVFGSGIVGSTGSGVALTNGMDLGDPAYIAFQPGSGFGWSNLEGFLSNFRFVVQGSVVPEPTSILTFALAVVPLVLQRSPGHSGRRKC
jgi:hypothetical protein